MPDEASFCTRCGASFVVPQKIKALLADATVPGGAEAERILRFCPSCRPQQFAEETIGNDLRPVPRHWPLPKRRSEERRPIRTDARTGATVTKSQCYICNSGCDALVFEKDGRVIRVEGDPSSAITKGTLCCKGLASKEQLYHEDRLLYPLKRSRGTGRAAGGRGSPGTRRWTRPPNGSRGWRRSTARTASSWPRGPSGGPGATTSCGSPMPGESSSPPPAGPSAPFPGSWPA